MVYMVYICMCRTPSAHINIRHIYIYMVYMVYICMCRTPSAHINIWHIYIYIYIWCIWYIYACAARPLHT